MTAIRNAVEVRIVLPLPGQTSPPAGPQLESSIQLADFHPAIPPMKGFASVTEDGHGEKLS